MSGKVYEIVSERVISAIEDAIKEGKCAPWQQPWHGVGYPTNLVSKKQYKGINVFMLACLGFSSPYFLTFNQVRERGGKVKQGAKGFPVVFWKMLKKSEKQDDGTDKDKNIPLLRYYTVFNVEQCEGLKLPEEGEKREFNPIEEGDKIIANMPNAPKIEVGGRACYSPMSDVVTMPSKESFKGDSEYYSTVFHELGHSTGHVSRLNREDISSPSFGTDSYAREELVAEMTATFLCNHAHINGVFDNSVAYLRSWLKRIKDDMKLMVWAAGRAQKAAEYIIGTQEIEEDEE